MLSLNLLTNVKWSNVGDFIKLLMADDCYQHRGWHCHQLNRWHPQLGKASAGRDPTVTAVAPLPSLHGVFHGVFFSGQLHRHVRRSTMSSPSWWLNHPFERYWYWSINQQRHVKNHQLVLVTFGLETSKHLQTAGPWPHESRLLVNDCVSTSTPGCGFMIRSAMEKNKPTNGW